MVVGLNSQEENHIIINDTQHTGLGGDATDPTNDRCEDQETSR